MKSDNTFMGVKPGEKIEFSDKIFFFHHVFRQLASYDVTYIEKVNSVYLFKATVRPGNNSPKARAGYFSVADNIDHKQGVHVTGLYGYRFGALSTPITSVIHPLLYKKIHNENSR